MRLHQQSARRNRLARCRGAARPAYRHSKAAWTGAGRPGRSGGVFVRVDGAHGAGALPGPLITAQGVTDPLRDDTRPVQAASQAITCAGLVPAFAMTRRIASAWLTEARSTPSAYDSATPPAAPRCDDAASGA